MMLPLKKNQVVFEAASGRKISDNPLAIFEYMKKNTANMEFIWVLDEPANITISDATIVRKYSVKYFVTMARTKYIVTNDHLPSFFQKRKEQVLVQTTQGTPILPFGLDKQEKSSIKQSKAAARDVGNWDYLVSQNAVSTAAFKSGFGYKGAILECGYPRNSKFSDNGEASITGLRSKFGIKNQEEIVIVYVPTFTKSGEINNEDLLIDLEMINKIPRVKFLIKLDDCLDSKLNLGHYKNVTDVSNSDSSELCLVADLLLSDYSSVIHDYLLLDKPLVLFPNPMLNSQQSTYLAYNKLPAEQIDQTQRLAEITDNIKGYKALWQSEYDQYIQNQENLQFADSAKTVVTAMLKHK